MRLATALFALAVFACDGSSTCTPESDQSFCERNGKDCDSYTGFDNCGASRTVACGTCELPETCGGAGVVNVCGSPSFDGGTDAGMDAGMDAGPPAPVVVLAGTITNNPDMVNMVRSIDAFDPIEGVPIECRVTIPSLTRTTEPGTFGERASRYQGLGSDVVCTGSTASVVMRIQDNLTDPGTRVNITLEEGLGISEATVTIVGPEGSDYFSIIGSCSTTFAEHDADGYPILAPFGCDPDTVYWRRFMGPPEVMTDYAESTGSVDSEAEDTTTEPTP